jgi:hypothetical protein
MIHTQHHDYGEHFAFRVFEIVPSPSALLLYWQQICIIFIFDIIIKSLWVSSPAVVY